MKQPELNLEQDVTLTIHPDFQASVFTINGPAEAVLPIAEQVQAEDAQNAALQTKRQTLTAPIARAAVAAPEAVEAPLLTGRRATIAARLYDMAHGRNMYDLLKQKREDERDLAMATKLGLLSVDDTYCRKHQKAVAKLHGLDK